MLVPIIYQSQFLNIISRVNFVDVVIWDMGFFKVVAIVSKLTWLAL